MELYGRVLKCLASRLRMLLAWPVVAIVLPRLVYLLLSSGLTSKVNCVVESPLKSLIPGTIRFLVLCCRLSYSALATGMEVTAVMAMVTLTALLKVRTVEMGNEYCYCIRG